MRRLVTLALAGVLLAGCGSGAVEEPDDDPRTTPARTSAGTPEQTTEEPEEYDFSLPKGDRSVSLNEAIAYDDLHQGKCDEAQRFMDGEGTASSPAWRGFISPRNVLLWQAGIELCRGDTDAARPWYERAEGYGWVGLGEFHACELYRAAGSAIRQRPKTDFTCQRGEAPPWPGDDPSVRVDPRTDIDDGQTSPSPTPA
ncbi:MAG: hypothetical protein ACRDT6_15895 [Micromonosporaceae bacterium]